MCEHVCACVCVCVSEVNSGDEDAELKSADSSWSSRVGSGHVDSGIVRGRGKGPVRGARNRRKRRGKVKRNTTSAVWAALHWRCWEGIKNQLLRKMLKNQKEAANMGLILSRKVRTGPERARWHLRRTDLRQRRTQQPAARSGALTVKPGWMEERGWGQDTQGPLPARPSDGKGPGGPRP